LNIGDAFPF